jgi:hypothetical protein
MLDREVMAEYSTMENILHHAQRAEEKTRKLTRWHAERRANQGVHMDAKRRDTSGTSKSAPKINHRGTLYTATSTVKGKERAVDKGQTKGKPFVARTSPSNRDGALNKDAPLSQLKCFRCGQQGHKANDLRYHPDVTTTKTKAAQIYAAREIVDDDDQDNGHDDQEEAPVEDNGGEEEEPYDGSQYTSDGEEMVFDRLQGYGSSDEEQPPVEFRVMNMGWNDGDRYTIVDEDCLKCLEEQELWELETDSSPSDDEGFPLFVEVMDSEDKGFGYQSNCSENQGETLEGASETDSESDEEIVYEAGVLISAMRSGVGLPSPKTKMTTVVQPVKLRKSSKLLERPVRTKKETKAFIAMVKVNGQEAVALSPRDVEDASWAIK